MFKPGWLERVGLRWLRASGRLTIGDPFQFDLGSHHQGRAGYPIAIQQAFELDGLGWTGLHLAFDAPIPESTLEWIAPKLAGELCPIQHELQAVIVVVVEELQVRNPFAG